MMFKPSANAQSLVEVDPLLRAIFDLPCTIPVWSESPQLSTINGEPSLKGHVTSAVLDDDGGASDVTSILLGESISLTDDEFPYAVCSPSTNPQTSIDYNVPTNRFPDRSTAEPKVEKIHEGNNASNPKFDCSKPINSVPDKTTAEFKVDTISQGNNASTHDSKTKKKRLAPLNSLKRLVSCKIPGKSKSHFSRKGSTSTTSSSDKEDSLSSIESVRESVAFQTQNFDDRIPGLQARISSIRCNILSLERDLIATRNDLARAHDHLQSACLELGDIQRASLEADIQLTRLLRKQNAVSSEKSAFSYSEEYVSCRSIRSISSERLNYFTPTSSSIDAGNSDECYTPTSSDSFASCLSNPSDTSTEGGRVVTSLLKESRLLQKNKIRREANVSDFYLRSVEQGRPDRVVGEQGHAKTKFHRKPCFMRAHDLTIANASDSSPLVSLHGQDFSLIIDALFERGLRVAMDESDNWKPVRDTEKFLRKRSKEVKGPIGAWTNAASGDDVLVWYAPCNQEGHGSEYPIIKARALIPASAFKVVELLLDSDRVKRYNKMSQGRVDEYSFSKGVDDNTRCPETGVHGETKICLSRSQPPVIRKQVELRILLHARRLHAEGRNNAKYITVGRSVWETADGKAESSDAAVTRCEMLLSANMIRDLGCQDGKHYCEITTITHAASPPGIPLAIGRRVGLAAAGNYLGDIRAAFKNDDV